MTFNTSNYFDNSEKNYLILGRFNDAENVAFVCRSTTAGGAKTEFTNYICDEHQDEVNDAFESGCVTDKDELVIVEVIISGNFHIESDYAIETIIYGDVQLESDRLDKSYQLYLILGRFFDGENVIFVCKSSSVSGAKAEFTKYICSVNQDEVDDAFTSGSVTDKDELTIIETIISGSNLDIQSEF
ncbi:hypothetical protein [Photobacterium damselae]|uniref:hypothetical protein n=1 Tax=Photobacterium damselae TaxID=38293 RepID=UPI00406979DB